MCTLIVPLPWSRPPLTMNGREHWRTRAKVVKDMRTAAGKLAQSHRAPRGLVHATVGLHYRPRDNRRRDADNLVPVLKACADGLVDYGLVADDTPDLMTKTMPRIHPAQAGLGGHLWLEITWKAT